MPRTPETDTDRGLLCGIFAQRRGYITQDAFLHALRAWSEDPATPIRHFLAEQGGLTANHQAELETLVEHRLSYPVGRSSESTADYRSRADTADPGEPAPDDPYKTHPVTPAASAPAGGTFSSTETRFRIIRFHAQGGLGQVSVALDRELNREVALKEIQERYADNDRSRSRFVFEAEVTGGLEHPGVVPVYALGAYPDGRPYYAMRFIRGKSLKQSIVEFHKTEFPGPGSRAVELRKLLDRFRAVCYTMDYSHSRHVIHRDLKPDNVMLGDYGETLVVDWGLAKKLDGSEESAKVAEPDRPTSAAQSDPTQMGRVMGTPAYMSPEQAAGRIDQIGPPSDVYSLGATLYCLLTGRAPFLDLDLKVLIKKVEQGEIAPPRQVRPDVPRGLEAICLKAMALKPEERYPSPRALAEDLEKWLADDPVSAYPEPWTVRARRWISRHRTFVVSGAAVLVVAVASLSLVAAVLSIKNKDLKAANKRERDAKIQANEQRDQAKKLFQLSQVVYGEMGATKSVADVFEVAAAKTQTLADEHPDVAEYQRILALAHVNLGLWYKQTSKSQEAEHAYKRSQAVMQKLADRHPDEIEYQRDLARSQNNLAILYSETGRFNEAMAIQVQTLAMQQALADAHPELPLLRSDVARTLANRGVVYWETDRAKDAEADYVNALAIREALLKDQPDERALQVDVAVSHHNLGLLYGEQGRIEEAERAEKQAFALCLALAAKFPQDPEIQEDLADEYNSMGKLFMALKRQGAAIEMFQKGLDIQRRLAKAHPNLTAYQYDMAISLQNLGVIFDGEMHQKESAEESYKEARDLLQRLATAHPEITRYQETLADIFNNQANLFVNSGRLLEAETGYLESVAILERLVRDHPSVVDFARILGGTYGNLGLLLTGRQKKPATGMAWYERSMRTLETVLRRDPQNASARETLKNITTAHGLSALGAAFLQTPADVAQDWDHALDLYTGPDRAYLRLQRARAWARLEEHARAAAEASALLKTQVSAENIYDAAAVYAVSVAAVAKDDKLAGPEKEKLAEQYASDATAALRQAKADDFFNEPANVERLRKDADFSAVRERKDFKALVAELEKKE